MSSHLERELTVNERAELEALRDLAKRLLNFGGDDTVLMPWVDAHRHHAEEPYIGCVFCRGQFISRADVERLLSDTSRHFAGDHLNAGVVVGEMRRRLHGAP